MKRTKDNKEKTPSDEKDNDGEKTGWYVIINSSMSVYSYSKIQVKHHPDTENGVGFAQELLIHLLMGYRVKVCVSAVLSYCITKIL